MGRRRRGGAGTRDGRRPACRGGEATYDDDHRVGAAAEHGAGAGLHHGDAVPLQAGAQHRNAPLRPPRLTETHRCRPRRAHLREVRAYGRYSRSIHHSCFCVYQQYVIAHLIQLVRR
jgi:hypothetical protein